MRRATFLAVGVTLLAAVPVASADTIHVKSTTDTVDAGLVEGLIQPAFTAGLPDDTLEYIAPAGGTGAALDAAKAGQADVVITHAPTSEAQFVADGFTDGPGYQIFFSDYVIVGPRNDPAGVIAKGHDHDTVSAYEDIAKAGVASQSGGAVPTVGFKSRGNSSGTSVQEQIIWAQTTGLNLQTATAAGTDTSRKEPVDTAPAGKQWYTKTAAGQAANLTQTDTCAGNTNPANPSGCYTMVDRGTFNRNVNNGTVTKLKIVADRNAAGKRGGENLLINAFSAYIVKPSISQTTPKPSQAAVKRFIDLLTSAGFQKDLESFPNSVDPAFSPDAFAKVTLTNPLPAAVVSGTPVTIAGTVANRLPGGGAVGGQSVQLQQSTDQGKTFSNVGAPATTSATGAFSLSATPTALTAYRVSLPAAGAVTGAAMINGSSQPITYNQFTPSTTDLGTVNTTPAPTTSPAPVATVPPTKDPGSLIKDDNRPPKLTKLKLTRTRLKVHVNEEATVKIVIQRVGSKAKTTVRFETGSAESVNVRHRALRKGRYRLRITATDFTGNQRISTKSLRRK